MEITLYPSIEQKCTGLTVARGLTWDTKTGLALPYRRSGVQPQDPSIDPYAAPKGAYYYNIAQRYRDYYARILDSLTVANYVIYTSRFGVDFYAPENFLDTSRYYITSAKIKIYCDVRIPNHHPVIPIKNFTLNCGERYNYASRLFDAGLIDSGILHNYLNVSAPLQSAIISNVGSWYTFTITNSDFLNRLQNIYIPQGFIPICFKQNDEQDYPNFTEDSTVAGYVPVFPTDPPIVQRPYDWDDFTHAHFSLFDGAYLPQLILTCELIRGAGTISSFSITRDRSKYSATLNGSAFVSDPDEMQQQLQVEIAYALPGGKSGDYILASTTTITPPVSGALFPWSADISIPVSGTNLIYTQNKWLYDSANSFYKSTYSDGIWTIQRGGSVSVVFPAERLKPNTFYVFKCTSNGHVSIIATTANGSETVVGPSPSIAFNSANDSVTLTIYNSSASPKTISDIILEMQNANPNDYYYIGTCRARCVENQYVGDYVYVAQPVIIDNRIPSSVLITENSSQNEIWQDITPSGVFSWTESFCPVGISGYRVQFSSTKYPSLNEYNSLFTTNRTYAVSTWTEGKWYFSVAPVANNGLIGNTSSYGFWYNVKEQFVDTSGFKVNGVEIGTDENTWVPNYTNPQFSWIAPNAKPGNIYTYDLQVGSSGGVGDVDLIWDIDWSLIDEAAAKAFFRFILKDYTGIIYIERSTDTSSLNWYWYDGSWHPMEDPNDLGLLRSTNATKIKYTLSNRDGAPDSISLLAFLETGWFNTKNGGYIEYGPMCDPISLYFGNYGYGDIVEETVTGNNTAFGVYMEIEYNGKINIYRSTITNAGFLWKNPTDLSWQIINGVTPPLNSVDIKICLEPYMQIPAGANYICRWKYIRNGVIDESWIGTVTRMAINPHKNAVWLLYNPEISVSGITNNSYVCNKQLSPGITYYARARVHDGCEYGDWSKIFKFKINSIPMSPQGLRLI